MDVKGWEHWNKKCLQDHSDSVPSLFVFGPQKRKMQML